MTKKDALIRQDHIQQAILVIRDQRVMLDSSLAELYGVPTKVLLQSVKRNLDRFPNDFMFRLNYQQVTLLRSQFVTSSLSHGGRRYLPYAFTEQGIAMLSSVLKSKTAIYVNIEIMRAFVRIRNIMNSNLHFMEQINNLEKKYLTHDKQIQSIFEAIRSLMEPPEPKKRKVGF